MLNTLNINLKTDIKTDRPTALGIKVMSQDKNNNQFILRFTNGGEPVNLDGTYTVEILTKFQNSGASRLTSATVRQDYATWEFDTAYITQDEMVYNYVYVRKAGSLVVSADANAFYFDVGLSEIDKDAGRVAEVYDENYQKYLDEFKNNVDFEEIAQAESDRQANEDIRQANELLREENYNQKVDTAIVEADVVSKVDNKVTELTPQITNLTAQLAQTEAKLPQNAKSLFMQNDADASKSLVDLKHFGIQNNNIAFVIHNYSDGKIMQLDNVGVNTALQIVNAFNPVYRADKPDTFIGTGPFLDIQEYQVTSKTNQSLFKILNNANLDWSGLKGTTVLTNRKTDTSTFVFEFRATTSHYNLMRIGNASQYVLSLLNDMPINSVPTRAIIESYHTQTNGLLLRSAAGDVTIAPKSGITKNTGSLEASDNLKAGKHIHIGTSTTESAPINSLFLEGSILKYKNNAGITKVVNLT